MRGNGKIFIAVGLLGIFLGLLSIFIASLGYKLQGVSLLLCGIAMVLLAIISYTMRNPKSESGSNANADNQALQSVKFYDEHWFRILMIFLCWPLAVALFAFPKHRKKSCLIVVGVVVFVTVIAIVSSPFMPKTYEGERAFSRVCAGWSGDKLNALAPSQMDIARDVLTRYGKSTWTYQDNADFIKGFVDAWNKKMGNDNVRYFENKIRQQYNR